MNPHDQASLSDEFVSPTSLRDLALILFKWKWSIIVILVTGLIGSVIWLWVIRDDIYQVSAKVLVKIGHEQTSSTTALNDKPIPVLGERAQDVNSEVDILQNKELLNEVISELHLDVPSPKPPYPERRFARLKWHFKDLSSRFRDWKDEVLIRAGLRPRLTYRERVLALLSDGLIVTAQKDSNVIVASMFVGVREGGSIILNTLIDKYLTHRLVVWKGQSTDEFFATNLRRTSEELQAAEAALRSYEQAHDITVLQKQQEVLLGSIADQQQRVSQALLALEEANGKVARIKAELAKPEPDFATLGEFPQGSFSDAVMQQLAGLKRETEQMRMTELEDGLRVQNLRKQFSVLLQGVVSNVSAAADERKATYEAGNGALSEMQKALQELHSRELEWNNLKRRVSMAEQSYLLYRGKSQEASGLAQLEERHIGNVAVVERASDAVRTAGTRKLTLLSGALAVVLLAAFAWVAVAEFFDHRIYSAEALERYAGVPTIGMIPKARAARLRHAIRPAVAAAEQW